MILTCPRCETRFRLPAEELMPDGKRVRCSACKQIWFTKPEIEDHTDSAQDDGSSDDVQSDDQSDLADNDADEENLGTQEDIPESVKPEPEEEPQSFDQELTKQLAKTDVEDTVLDSNLKLRFLNSIVASIVVFFMIGIMLVVFQTSFLRSIPHTAYIYQMFALSKDVSGKGLVFDRVQTSLERDDQGQAILNMNGFILNLSDQDMHLPIIVVETKNAVGEVFEQFIIELTESSVQAEQSIRFEASQPVSNETDISSITVQFRIVPPKPLKDSEASS